MARSRPSKTREDADASDSAPGNAPRIGTPVKKPKRLFRLLPITAGGATGAVYGALVAKALRRRGFASGDRTLPLAMTAGALLGAAFTGAGAMLAGTPYDYDTYKIPDDGKPVVIAFSGANGGVWKRPAMFDAKRMPVNSNYDVQFLDTLFGKGNYALFAKDDVDAALDYVAHLPKGTDIRVIGHSMGGPAAYDLAQRAAEFGIKIKRLDTLDPVGKLFGAKMDEKPVNVKNWNNYIPKEYDDSTYSNLVARIGGPIREAEGAKNHIVDNELGNHVAIRYVIGDERGHRFAPPENIPKSAALEDEMKDSESFTQAPETGTAAATAEYRDYVRRREREQRDKEITSSVNALGALGATAGTGMLIAGRDRPAAMTLGGIAGGAGGYHLARMFGASPAVRLLVAALTSSGSVYAAHKFVS